MHTTANESNPRRASLGASRAALLSLATGFIGCISPNAAPLGRDQPAATGGVSGTGGGAISLPSAGKTSAAGNGGMSAVATAPECRTNVDCAPPLPYCVSNPARCVECFSNTNCAGTGKRYCDVMRYTCANCLSDAHCTAALPYCSEEGECVQCLSSHNCGSTLAACEPSLHRCVSTCNGDDDCSADLGRPFCNGDLNECVQCVADEDCPPIKAHCLLSVGTCEKCSKDADCASPTPRCGSKSHVCVECASNADCKTGYACQAEICTIIPD